MNDNTVIYAWFYSSLGGFVEVGRRPKFNELEFNDCAVHFEGKISPASPEELRQLAAICQIGAAVAADEVFRKRCMRDLNALHEVSTLVPIVILKPGENQ